MTELETVVSNINNALAPEDVFGLIPGTENQSKLLALIYRQIVAVVHPDRVDPKLKVLAEGAFVKLTKLKADADEKVRVGTYGDRSIAPPAPPPPPRDPLLVQVGKRKYTVTDVLYQGDICDHYACSYAEPKPKPAPKPKLSTKDKKVATTIWDRLDDDDIVDDEDKPKTKPKTGDLIPAATESISAKSIAGCPSSSPNGTPAAARKSSTRPIGSPDWSSTIARDRGSNASTT